MSFSNVQHLNAAQINISLQALWVRFPNRTMGVNLRKNSIVGNQRRI